MTWATRRRTHARFLALAARLMDGPLGPGEEERLAAHLAGCEPCRGWVAGYEHDRAALHELRRLPIPPSHLWARTSAALDRERGRRVAPTFVRGTLRTTVGLAATLMVMVAVIGSGVVPGFPGPLTPQTAGPLATPFAVEPQVLAFVSDRGGDVGLYVGQVDQVCPEIAMANCRPLDADVRKVISFGEDFVPQQLSVAPDGRTATIVGTSSTGGAIYALSIPVNATTPGPSASGSAEPTGTPTTAPSPSLASGSPAASASPAGSPTASSEGSPFQSPEESASPSVELAAILQDVILTGESPAYSADGTMLAFSARPDDDSAGPDIYLWQVGWETAQPLTTDHASYFASWVGRSIVGSRSGASADGERAAPESFLLDPSSNEVRVLAHAGWRPIVDPSGRFVIYWDGTLRQEGPVWREAVGGLYLAPWSVFDPTVVGGPPAAAPSSEATAIPASPSEAASPEASGGATAQQLDPVRDYERDPVLSWEARWSPDGRWFGAWVGDAQGGQPETGRLSVASLDATTGRIERDRTELDGEPALRGFALGNHRVAWATIPGAQGTSVVRLLVWNDSGRGTLHTQAGDGNDTLPGF